MSIKEFIKKNKKWLLLACVGIIAAAGTIAFVLSHGYADEQAELTQEAQAEQDFHDLLDRATAEELPTEVQLPTRTPRENPWADLVDPGIELLSLEERLRIWYVEYGIEVPEKELDFDVLYDANEHIYAWIYIPNTRINYPILQHATTNTHYLYHNIDGSRGFPGAIFTENFNTTTFLDRMTVVYGHRLREGTMFTPLLNFARQEFFEEHPYIFVYIEDDIFVYRVFSAIQTSNAHLLLDYHFFDDEVFLEYLNNITEPETIRGVAVDTIEFNVDSRIIALSTCVEDRPRERFIVFGILVEREGFFHPRLW